MKTIEISEMELHLREVLSEVASGTEVVVAEDDAPIARLVPLRFGKKARIPGLHEGEIFMSDDFDSPLPDEFWYDVDTATASAHVTAAGKEVEHGITGNHARRHMGRDPRTLL